MLAKCYIDTLTVHTSGALFELNFDDRHLTDRWRRRPQGGSALCSALVKRNRRWTVYASQQGRQHVTRHGECMQERTRRMLGRHADMGYRRHGTGDLREKR